MSPERLIQPRMKGFVSLDSHPAGCRANVEALVTKLERRDGTMGPVVVVGSSTGYGLATAVVAAFAYGAPVVGVCLERPAERARTASAGWYNVAALHDAARREGARITTINADCFAPATKAAVAEQLEAHMGPAELLVYSVAAPVRVDPATGARYRSVIKPIGSPLLTKTVNLDTGALAEMLLEPASPEEIEDTRRVMGGEDWADWIAALGARGVLADDFRTVAYSYVGSELTAGIYRSGTIGAAKEHLEKTALELAGDLDSRAYTSVNGAVITQASAAIPGLALYISLLLAAARDSGVQVEDTADQALRLFDDHLGPGRRAAVDRSGRIRLDDWEMEPGFQAELARRWAEVNPDNFARLGDFGSFRAGFRHLFGFDVEGVDYQRPVEVNLTWET